MHREFVFFTGEEEGGPCRQRHTRHSGNDHGRSSTPVTPSTIEADLSACTHAVVVVEVFGVARHACLSARR